MRIGGNSRATASEECSPEERAQTFQRTLFLTCVRPKDGPCLPDRQSRETEEFELSSQPDKPRRIGRFGALAPGILVVATGVGAGDLLTASLAGSALGVVVVWAACAGAVLKWFLNEGIARWQMATGTTLLEGWVTRLGRWIQWVFLVYLIVWTFVTGGALVTACGIAATAVWPIGDSLSTSKVIWGIIHSIAGLILVLVGGFKLFTKLMSVFIGVMFVAVIATAVLIRPDWSAIGGAILSPSIPEGGTGWVLGVLGGVGGTLTMLSYGYWIREAGRTGTEGVRSCRIDLAVAYVMTGMFGVAMVVIGSRVSLDKGPTVALDLASQLQQVLGALGKWLFLIGFWGAVFSSLLGVWQSVPYMFADFLAIRGGLSNEARLSLDFTKTTGYRVYLFALALVPLPMLTATVKTAQLSYAIMGSLFMPLLAVTLLIMNNKTKWVGRPFRNGWITNLMLAATLAFFVFVAGNTAYEKLWPPVTFMPPAASR